MKEKKREKVFLKYKGHCAYCGKPLNRETFTVDHVIPKSKGGTNDIENLLPCCFDCNQQKGQESIEMLRLHLFWSKHWNKIPIGKMGDFAYIRKEATKFPMYYEKRKAVPHIPETKKKAAKNTKKTTKGS